MSPRSSTRPPYFYPRPPRGGRLHQITAIVKEDHISTHALREEGDLSAAAQRRGSSDFYPRPPRGGRHTARPATRRLNIFLPTPSARRATTQLAYCVVYAMISTHALREEGDSKCAIK